TTIKNQLVNGILTPVASTTTADEDTRTRLIDIPILLRYYNIGRHTPGPRWFVEGGAEWRKTNNLRSSLATTDANGTTSCCTSAPGVPARNNAKGVVSGAGVQLIDPLGIRVVPEVRYTRWFDSIFNATTTNMQRNEVTASFSLTF